MLDNDIYGDQIELTEPIDNYEGEAAMENRIQELLKEIELYKQAIQDAKDALDSASQELDEVLIQAYMKENPDAAYNEALDEAYASEFTDQ